MEEEDLDPQEIRELGSLMRTRAMQEDVLDRQTEIDLAKRWRLTNDRTARDRLVSSHQKLVVGMIRRLQRPGGPSFEDLYNQGVIGLIVAAEKFDPEAETRFATYAQWQVLAAMQELLFMSRTQVRIGKKEKKIMRALAHARFQNGGQVAQIHRERIAQVMGVTITEVEGIEAATATGTLSLHQPISGGEDEGAVFMDTLVDESQGPEAMMRMPLEEKRNRVVGEIMKDLEDRERTVIQERFLGDTPCTLRTLAERMNISAERVRQIEREALSKLRRALSNRGFNPDDILSIGSS